MKSRQLYRSYMALASLLLLRLSEGENLAQENLAEMSDWAHYSVAAQVPESALRLEGARMTLEGNGADIWGKADSFDFAYVPWIGDGVFVCQVLDFRARHEWAKAGIMLREALAPDASHAFVSLAHLKGVNFIRRGTSGGESVDDSHHLSRAVLRGESSTFVQRSLDAPPDASGALNAVAGLRWLKLVRQGDVFQAFDSEDGFDWHWLGTDRISMPPEVFVGIALSSHDPNTLATLQVDSWSATQDPVSFAVTPVADAARFSFGSGSGLRGEYFSEINLSGESSVRTDPVVDFEWQKAAPFPDFPRNQFSVRWTGELEADLTGLHYLHLQSDDRARLWLDGSLLIDEWREHALQESTALVSLEAGRRYSLRIDYFENRGDASIRLLWSHPMRPKETVPTHRLYPSLKDSDGDQLPNAWEERFGLDAVDASDADRLAVGDDLSFIDLYQAGAAPRSSSPVGRQEYDEGWVGLDIGPVGDVGFSELNLERQTAALASFGVAVGEVRDGLRFVYRKVEGDFAFQARLDSLDSDSAAALAGLMVRQNRLPESPYVFLGERLDGQLELQFREHAATLAARQLEISSGSWLRVERQGAVYRLYVSSDGQDWNWMATRELMGPGPVCLGLAASSGSGAVSVRATWSNLELLSLPKIKKPKTPKRGRGDGLAATFFSGGREMKRSDAQIDFDWDEEAPFPGFPSDDFGARWEGVLEVPEDGEYMLEVVSDDGARLWLDDVLVLDDWRDSGLVSDRVRVRLNKKRLYRIRLEYYEREGEAIIQWYWSSETIARSIVPQDRLFSSPERLRESFEERLLTRVADSAVYDRSVWISGNESILSLPGEDLDDRRTLDWRDVSRELEQTLLPENAMPYRGAWEQVDTHLVAGSRNGGLGFEFSVSQPGIYFVELSGGAWMPHRDPLYSIRLLLDEVDVGNVNLLSGSREVAGLLTPYLQSGEHSLNLEWENVQLFRHFRFDQIRIYRLVSDKRGKKAFDHWVDAELERANVLDEPPKKVFVSPHSLEGRSLFVPLTRVQIGDELLAVQAAAGKRWWADVPLLAEGKTEVEIEFENGGKRESVTLEWVPIDMAKETGLTVREGASVQFVADQKAKGKKGKQPVDYFVDSEMSLTSLVSESVMIRFDQAGTRTVVARYTDDKGKAVEQTLLVEVLPRIELGAIAALVGKYRDLNLPAGVQGLVVEAGQSVDLRAAHPNELDGVATVSAKQARKGYLTFRSHPGGLPLGTLRVDGFRFSHGLETGGLMPIKTFFDGTKLLETTLVLSPVVSNLELTVEAATAGILFEEGVGRRRIRSEAFNELGEFVVRFIQGAKSITGVCHRIRVTQDEVILGQY